MNYLKLFLYKSCGYLIDTLFTPKNTTFDIIKLHLLPTAVNDSSYIYSLYYYKNADVKKIIKLIKYKGDRKTTEYISKLLHDYLLEDISEKLEIYNFSKPIIIPIPATKQRMKKYGFNQCDRITKNIEKIDKNRDFEYLYNILIKIKDNESQAHTSSKTERIKNIKNSFAVFSPEKILKRNIILIDDVWTTGATLDEAKGELLKAGAKSVVAYTIAH